MTRQESTLPVSSKQAIIQEERFVASYNAEFTSKVKFNCEFAYSTDQASTYLYKYFSLSEIM
jgi:hypothetical protein